MWSLAIYFGDAGQLLRHNRRCRRRRPAAAQRCLLPPPSQALSIVRDVSTMAASLSAVPKSSSRPSGIPSLRDASKASKTDMAFSTVGTALAILQEVGEMTANVPYIKALSGLVLQIIKIKDDVHTMKEKWAENMRLVLQIQKVIDDFHDACVADGKSDGDLPDYLVRALRGLESTLQDVLSVLAQCTGKRKRDFIKKIANRSQLTKAVDACGRDVQNALTILNMRLVLYQGSTMNDVALAIKAQMASRSSPAYKPAPPVLRRPYPFIGRDVEVNDIVNRIVRKTPARIAILGPGGMGKTSVALAALNMVQDQELYHDACYFVSCEAILSASDLITKLALTFDIAIEPDDTSIERKVMAYLKSVTCMLCLDNFETPWEAQTIAVEELLAQITSLQNVGLIITVRGEEYPASTSWDKSPLDIIKPLDFESAIQTFQNVSQKSDEYSAKLIQAVDCVPLAVNLLAHLAQTESTASLWQRWEKGHTTMVKRNVSKSRLTSLDHSIMLSLESARMAACPLATEFLGILSMLPDGLQLSKVSDLQLAYDEKINIEEVIAVLKQNSLVYISLNDRLSILSPIRLVVLQVLNPSQEMKVVLQEYYMQQIEEQDSNGTFGTARAVFMPEIGNVQAVLENSLHDYEQKERVVGTIAKFSEICYCLGLSDIGLISKGTSIAVDINQKLYGNCLYQWGKLYLQSAQYEEAAEKLHDALSESSMNEALQLHQEVKDVLGQANDLQGLGEIYLHKSDYVEAEKRFLQALKLHKEEGSLSGQADDMRQLGKVYYMHLSDYVKAEEYTRQALTLNIEANDVLGQGHNFLQIGHIYSLSHQHTEAEKAFVEAETLYDQISDVPGQATNCYQKHGETNLLLTELKSAKENFLKAYDLYCKVGDLVGQGNALRGLGDLAISQSDLDSARERFSAALAVQLKSNDTRGRAYSVFFLGKIHRFCSEIEAAKKRFTEAISLHKIANDILGEANAVMNMGEIYMQCQQLPQAQALFEEAFNLYIKAEDAMGAGNTLAHQGDILLLLSDIPKAKETFQRALDFHNKSCDKMGIASDLQNLAKISLRSNDLTAAHSQFLEALKMHKETQNIHNQANTHELLGEVYAKQSDTEKAKLHYMEALKLHEQVGNILGQGNANMLLGSMDAVAKEWDTAEIRYKKALSLHEQAQDILGQANDHMKLGQL
ncbi:TPR-like protein, partial [Auriscalpium vulgare]